MHSLPPWYRLIYEFGYVFHSIADLLFIALAFLIIGAVSRPGWRHHLRWASPLAAGSFLSGTYRLVLDLHHYFHAVGMNVYMASSILLYLADVASMYGMWVLWRTLRDLTRHPASPDPLASYPAQPGVWPPPPTGRESRP